MMAEMASDRTLTVFFDDNTPGQSDWDRLARTYRIAGRSGEVTRYHGKTKVSIEFPTVDGMWVAQRKLREAGFRFIP